MAYDSYTKVMLHFNGVNQSQVFTDDIGNVWTATGIAQLDTAQQVFGSASMKNIASNGADYISAPYNAACNPGTGNYTFECRHRWNGAPANGSFFKLGPSTTDGLYIWWDANVLYVETNAGYKSFAWTPSADTWYHIAVTRQSGTMRAWIDGVQIGTDQTVTGAVSPASGSMYTGHYPGGNYSANAWTDELRWSVGIARWSAAFTPPLFEYGGMVFTSTSTLLVPTVTNLITKTADKFYSLGSLLVPTVYNEAWVGTVSETLPALTCVATGSQLTSGELQEDLPALTCEAVGKSGEVGSVSASIFGFRISATGLTGEVASLDLELPFLTIIATGELEASAIADLTLPSFHINAYGETSPAQFLFKVMAVNLKNFAVTEYENFDFNSFGQINDIYLGAKADGIYPLVGKTDLGEDIDVSLTTGKVFIEHFRLRDLFSYGLTGGQKRSKIARGLHSGYVDFTIQNENGDDFDLDYFEVLGDPVRRKKH